MRYLKHKIIAFVTTAALLTQAVTLTAFARPDWPSDTGIMAEAGIIMDMDSKTVLFGQNIHIPYPPASITKLLTALVVAENCEMDEVVTYSHDSIFNVESGSGNKLELEEGDTLSVEDSLYAMLLISDNPSANALAEHTAGSRDAFAEMMNEKLTELGCRESHFMNPSGLNDDNQYVSAYDMALIAIAAFQNEKVLEIASSRSHFIPATAKRPDGSNIKMEHRLLTADDTTSQYYLEGAVAGKTGFTSKAGNTLVTYAQRDGRNLVSVILKGTQPQYYMDAKTIMNFGFSSFKNKRVSDHETFLSEQDRLETNGAVFPVSELTLDQQAVITLPATAEFSDAERTLLTDLPDGHPEDAAAMLQYTYNGRNIGTAYLYAESLKSAPASSDHAAGAENPSESDAAGQAESQPTDDNPAEKETNLPSDRPEKGINWIAAVSIFSVLALVAGAAVLFQYRQRKEREALARRKERRRQRLMESGVSEEEFEALLQKRMQSASAHTGKKDRKHT